MLDEAGWTEKDAAGIRSKQGQRLLVQHVYDSASNSTSDVTLAQAIQFSVKQAGFDLQLQPVDAGGYSARVKANDYNLVAFWLVRAEPDILRTLFHSVYLRPNGGNVTRIKSLDQALNRATGASDEERKRLYGEVQREIIGQAYAVPLYVSTYRLGASKRLQGISWATNAKPNLYDASLSQ